MLYQLEIDGRKAAPPRETINEAAADAMDSGYAYPDRLGRIVLHDQAEIRQLCPQRKPN